MSEGKTFYEVALEDVPELSVAEEGEHRVQVISATLGESDNGPYFLLRLECPQIPNHKDFAFFVTLPREDDTDKQRIKRLGRLKETCKALGYDSGAFGGIDPDQFEGLEGWAHLGVEQDSTYGEQNFVVRWVAGQ